MTNNKTEGVDLYPGHQYQRLFNAISDTNGIGTQDELNEIIRIAHEDFPPSPPAGVEQRAKGGIWVKASERLPEKAGRENQVIVKFNTGVFYGFKNHDPRTPKIYIETDTHSFLTLDCEWLDETQSIAGSESQGREAGWVRNAYADWCNKTKRNGSVLVGGSMYEFFDWLEKH